MTSRKQDRVKAELEQIRKANGGKLPLKAVITFAQTHKRSDLHGMFTWNVKEAAYKYWLVEAREIVTRYVTVTVVHRKQTVTVPYYVRDPDAKTTESGYISTVDKLDCVQSKAIMVRRLQQIIAVIEASRDMAVAMDVHCPGLAKSFQAWLAEAVK